jgi:hypothetical protein
LPGQATKRDGQAGSAIRVKDSLRLFRSCSGGKRAI